MADPPRRPSTRRVALRLLSCAFLASGCVGLLLEQAFEKFLTTLLGASTPAASVVLAVYFTGLTAGAWAYARFRPAPGRGLRAYGLLEAGIGLWGFLLVLAMGHAVDLFAPVLRLGRDSAMALGALRALTACVFILPPTLAMGATFPAVVDAIDALRAPRPRRIVTRFYALNLAGAILGAALGPSIAFPVLGVDGTLIGAGIVDLAVCAAMLLLARRAPARRRPAGAVAAAGAPAAAARAPIVLLLVGATSGFLFFSLEVVWTHLISAVLGNSVYAFAEMLFAVLLSLGVGSGLSATLWRGESGIRTAVPAGALLIGVAIQLLWFNLWPIVPENLATLGGDVTSFAGAELLRGLHALLMIVPVAVPLGMVFPLLFRLDLFPLDQRPRTAGLLVAWNAVGCAAGALLTGFVAIPVLGSEAALRAITCGCACAGGVLGAPAFGARDRRAVALAAALAIAVWLLPAWDRKALTNGMHVYFAEGHVHAESVLDFFHEDTYGGITTVVRDPPETAGGPPRHTLLSNGKFQGNDFGEREAQTGIALVPVLHAPRDERCLVIGLGTGHSAHVAWAMGFRELDVADISPGIVAAARAKFVPVNRNVLEQGNVRVRLEDGRNVLLLDPRQYDVISMELSSVWFQGVTNLYSREFYRLARARLREDGVLQQWIQVHHIGVPELLSVLHSVRAEFPVVSFWLVGGQGVILASEGEQRLRWPAIRRFQEDPRLAAEREHWNEAERDGVPQWLVRLMSYRLLAPADLDRLPRTFEGSVVPLNTDANRHLEYATPRYNLDRRNRPLENVHELLSHSSDALPEVEGCPEEVRDRLMERVRESRKRYHERLRDAYRKYRADER